jgi:hypothetical protein
MSATGSLSAVGVDMDGDGDIDILTGTMSWYENDGFQAFTERVVSTAGAVSCVHAVDLDADGNIDIVTAAYSTNTVSWWRNNGLQVFTEIVITSSATGAYSVYSADIDGDGVLDVVYAARIANEVAWHKYNKDSGTFSAKNSISVVSSSEPYSVHAADIDGDGDMDMVASLKSSGKIVWYKNDGNQVFTSHDIATGISSPVAALAIDMDGDGDLDIVAAHYQNLYWYENDGAASPGFTAKYIGVTNSCKRIDAADMDGDGDIDVLCPGYETSYVSWYENDGAMSFTQHAIKSGIKAYEAHAVDVDRDGFMDVVTAGENYIAVYENKLPEEDCWIDPDWAGYTEIPDAWTSIADGAFSGCLSLRAVRIPISVSHIGTKAFYECSSLKSVILPTTSGTKRIIVGPSAFAECTSLTTYNISEFALAQFGAYYEVPARAQAGGDVSHLTWHPGKISSDSPRTAVPSAAPTFTHVPTVAPTPVPTTAAPTNPTQQPTELRAVYNANDEFSLEHNSGSVWTYGHMPTDFSSFTAFTEKYDDNNGVRGWHEPSEPYLLVAKRVIEESAHGIYEGQIALHPGPSLQPASVRFTAPSDGYYDIVGEFHAGQSGAATVGIRKGSTTLYTASDAGVFALPGITLSAGDTIDAVVYGIYDLGASATGLTYEIRHSTSPTPKYYNAYDGFSLVQNPHSVWSYGYMPIESTSFGAFAVFLTKFNDNVDGVHGWHEPALGFVKRIEADTTYGIASGNLVFQPGPNDEATAVRFTAPYDGYYVIDGEFYSGEEGAMSVGIRKDTSFLFHASDAGTFSITEYFNAFDTVDAMVYGGYTSGATGLRLKITLSSVDGLVFAVNAGDWGGANEDNWESTVGTATGTVSGSSSLAVRDSISVVEIRAQMDSVEWDFDIGPAALPQASFEAIVYLNALDNNRGWLFGSENGGCDRFLLLHDDRAGGTATSCFAGSSGLGNTPTGAWSHVIGVYDQATGNEWAWLNGVKGTVVTNAFHSEGVAGKVYIGLSAWVDHHANVDIASLRVYDTALTDEEVNTLFLDFVDATPATMPTQQPTYASLSVTSGLVANWDMSESSCYPGSGSIAYDLSGNSNNMNLMNGVTYDSDMGGGALVFDGVDDYATSAGPDLRTVDSTVIAISRYVTVDTSTGNGGGRVVTSNNNYILGHWDRSTSFYYPEDFVSSSSTGADDMDTDWHFYVGYQQYSTDTWTFYRDNVLTDGPSDAGYKGPQGFRFGSKYDNTQKGNGAVGLLLAYNRILTTSEVAEIYEIYYERYGLVPPPPASVPPAVTDGLTMFWDFADQNCYPGSGSYAFDLSGNDYTLSLVNGVGYDPDDGKGALVFDGTNDYAWGGYDQRYQDTTVIAVSRYASLGGRCVGSYNNWLLGHWDRSAKKYYSEGWVSSSDGAEGMTDLGWHFYAATQSYSRDMWSFYMDNEFVAQGTGGSQGQFYFSLGAHAGSDQFGNCKIAMVMVYNRILSNAEMSQLWEQYRYRYFDSPAPSPAPTVFVDPNSLNNYWLLGTVAGYGIESGADDMPGVLATLLEAMNMCAASASCDYVVDHGCDSSVFIAVGAALGGESSPKPYGVYLSDQDTVTDSNGISGYTATPHYFRFRQSSELVDLVMYPTVGWDSVGDTSSIDAPHCVFQTPIAPTPTPTFHPSDPSPVPTTQPTAPTYEPTPQPSHMLLAVTSGLMVHLDIANPNSYPGTGDTVTDLSGNGHDLTLRNGVSYDVGDSGGALVFDGVDDYASTATPNLVSVDSTIIAITRFETTSSVGRILSSYSNYLLGHWSDGSARGFAGDGWTAYYNERDADWHMYVGVQSYSTGSFNFYQDNVLRTNYYDGTNGPNGFVIGGWAGFSEFASGRFQLLLVYDRVLSTSEMTLLHDQFKGRYTLPIPTLTPTLTPTPAPTYPLDDAAQICANGEGVDCTCDGTIFYGRKYTSPSTCSGTVVTTLSDLLASNVATINSDGSAPVSCAWTTFGDPLPGVCKHCMCAKTAPRCVITVAGSCGMYPTQADKEFEDQHAGGPTPTTEAACETRRAAWQSSCTQIAGGTSCCEETVTTMTYHPGA